VFEIFSDAAKQPIMRAQDEAIGLGHEFVGTGHMLLGLLGEGDNAAAPILGSVGLDASGGPLVLARMADSQE
jgi:ATP-dependent Clp protease ATP-binding subunit ClpA